MIEARGVSAAYGSSPVVHEVDLQAQQGRVLGLIGPNGSGKTTLLRCLVHEIRPTAGTVRIDGDEVAGMSPRALARAVAVVAQDAASPLAMSVADTVLLGRSVHRGPLSAYTRDDHEVAARALQSVGARHLARREVTTLSGGERQRVLLARALAQLTPYLLLDEPTNHLDVRHQLETLGLVRALGCTTVLVLHDLTLAAQYCDDVVVLDAGRVVAAGEAAEVLVPEVLEPVYGVRVRVHDDDGRRHLLLGPTLS